MPVTPCPRCCRRLARAAPGSSFRLHEADPDLAVARLAAFPDALLLQPAADKPNHGLREAVILCPMGYAWVPSRRI